MTVVPDDNGRLTAYVGRDGKSGQGTVDAAGNVLVAPTPQFAPEQVLFNALAITDTATHLSTAVALTARARRVIYLDNGCAQAFTVIVSVSRDGVNWADITSTISVGASPPFSVLAETYYGNSPANMNNVPGLQGPWGYLRLKVTMGVTPSGGAFSAWLDEA